VHLLVLIEDPASLTNGLTPRVYPIDTNNYQTVHYI
jgi:hypothetical protein